MVWSSNTVCDSYMNNRYLVSFIHFLCSRPAGVGYPWKYQCFSSPATFTLLPLNLVSPEQSQKSTYPFKFRDFPYWSVSYPLPSMSFSLVSSHLLSLVYTSYHSFVLFVHSHISSPQTRANSFTYGFPRPTCRTLPQQFQMLLLILKRLKVWRWR